MKTSSETDTVLRVTAVTASAQLGGTERMLLDFASRAFEHDIALKVLTPLKGPLVQIFKDLGIPTAVVPAPESMLQGSQQVGHLRSLPPALAGLWRWSRDLARHEYFQDSDVAYSVAFKSHLALALARRHPVVWHLHEFPPVRTGSIWRFLAHRIPDLLIANSEAVGKAWGESLTSKDRLSGRARVVPNGINLDRFKPAERTYWIHDKLGIPHDHRLIGMPAVFARWKGQIEVLDAFSQISDEFPDVHLVIVGGSIYDTLAEREFGRELEIEVNRVATGEWAVVGVPGATPVNPPPAPPPSVPSLTPRAHLLPFQPKIERTFPEFDLAVHYSLRPEPFGRVIVEAMACGIPVIAANEGGPQEILGDGIGSRRESGWLAEPRDPAALAEILRAALTIDEEESKSIGAAGRRRAEDHYSWRHFSADVANVLKKAAHR